MMDYNKYNKFARQSATLLGTKTATGPFYYHYVSLPVLFSILEGDELWVSNIRFSNDSMEEMLLGDRRESRDDFVVCFSQEGNLLSQWRGYCPYGGACICFYMKMEAKLSVLHSDYDKSQQYEYVGNRPLPVIYFPENPNKGDIKLFKDYVNTQKASTKIDITQVWPYVKNGSFWEERESRMVFENGDGRFDSSIRFRTLENGVKVPYIIVKFGDVGKMSGRSTTNPSKIDVTFLENRYKKHQPIYVEEGSDQDKICMDIRKKIKDNKITKNSRNEFPILCNGHLPIVSITVAPSPDQDRLAEEIKRFCRSKYWLRDVYVSPSNIPYISSLRK